MKIAYVMCVFLIGLVSTFDVYMSVMYNSYLFDMEENFIAKHIIATYGVGEFIMVKSFMTIFVVIILTLLVETKYRVSVVWVTIFQLFLFIYLNSSFDCRWFNNSDHPDAFPIQQLIQYCEKLQI